MDEEEYDEDVEFAEDEGSEEEEPDEPTTNPLIAEDPTEEEQQPEVEDIDQEKDKEVDEEAEDDTEEALESKQAVVQVLKKDRDHRIIHIVPSNERTTSRHIQYPEMVEAIGLRISQIEKGAKVFTDVAGLTSATEMAMKEFLDGRNPFKLRREKFATATESWVEEWEVRDMLPPTELISMQEM